MVLTAVMFLVSTFQTVGYQGADAEPTTIDTFGDTDEDHAETVFLGGGSSLDNTIRLPLDVTVDSAVVSMKGSDDGSGNYPSSVTLDVYLKDNKKIFEFDEPDGYVGLGSWGKQTMFSDNTGDMKIDYKRSGEDLTSEIVLPKSANIESASMEMVAEEWDSLMSVVELTSTNDSVYDYDLSMEITQTDGKAYVAYKTFNKDWVGNWRDPGIVVQGSADGLDWSDPVQVNTKDDWINGEGAWDWKPDLFSDPDSGRLYCVWESNNTWDGTGIDYDILISWSDDPTTIDSWVTPIDISSPLEGTYSTHSSLTKVRSDTGAQYYDLPRMGKPQDWWPQGVVYDDELYVVWVTNDTSTTQCPFQGGPGIGSDIIMAKSSNGLSWSLVGEVTKDGATFDTDIGGDHAPSLVVHDNKLWTFWYTNDTTNGHDNSYNILGRSYNAGSNSWSSIYEVNHIGGAQNLAWDKAPFGFVFEGDLYCTWYTHCLEYSDGVDADIVVKKYDGDDWQVLPSSPDWNEYKEYEVTPMGDTTEHPKWGDFWPTATTYNNRIYLAWYSSDPHHTSHAADYDFDICYSSSTDGKVWTEVDLETGAGLEITERGLPGENGWDGDIHLGTMGDSLMFVWNTEATPTSAHSHPDHPTDADVVSRLYSDSSLPLDVKIDVGDDGTYEWQGALDVVTESMDFGTALQSILNSAEPTFTDSYGSEFVNVMVSVDCAGVGKVILDELEVIYDYRATTGDFAKDVNKYLDRYGADEADQDGMVDVPFKIISGSPGTVELYDLSLVYSYNPHINITWPAEDGADSTGLFKIYWEDEDLDDDAEITLFYALSKPAPEGLETALASGILKEIVTEIQEDPDGLEGDIYLWDMNELDDNNGSGKDYWVVARIEDGVSTHWDIAKSPIKLRISDFPPTITLLKPELEDEKGPRTSRRASTTYTPRSPTTSPRVPT
jgi:hypothetical protein